MALCQYCGKDMLEVDGCSCKTIDIFIDQWREFPRIRYGDPGDLMHEWYRKTKPIDNFEFPKRCGDCNCKVGHYHHWGCDSEACPECGMQMLSCGCFHILKEE